MLKFYEREFSSRLLIGSARNVATSRRIGATLPLNITWIGSSTSTSSNATWAMKARFF